MTDEELLELFHARRGVICAVGAGGKKSTLYRLLARHPGRVALTATVFVTHFPEQLGLDSRVADEAELPGRLAPLAEARRIAFAAPADKPGRHRGISSELVSRLHRETGREATFVKADGARMRWIKAPRPGEPVLPEDCSTVLCVLSARALGRPLSDEVAHRMELVAALTGLQTGDIVRPQQMARLMVSDAGSLKGTEGRVAVPILNMVDDANLAAGAREAARIALEETDRFDRVILTAMDRTDEPVVDVVER